MDWYARNDVQIMFNLEKVHYILDEMIMNGTVYETNKDTITKQLALMKIQPIKEKEKQVDSLRVSKSF